MRTLGLMLLAAMLFAARDAAAESPAAISQPAESWESWPRLPDPVGFAGPFAGVSNGALIVGGGANFPDRPPWEGGTKTWYDSAFVLDDPRGEWRTGFKLPQAAAYGVSITTPDGLICAGGGDASRHFTEVVRLEWINDRLVTTELPPLPKPCAFASGALLDKTLYLAGGLDRPEAKTTMHTFWSLDLSQVSAGWRELEPWPGPERMLAVAGVRDKSFFLFSGTKLRPGDDGKPMREYLRDAYRYRPGSGWTRLADLPQPTVAAPSPAAAVGSSHLLIFGGDDGSKVGHQPIDQHPGFSSAVLAYHTVTDTWAVVDTTPAPFVTTPLVPWQSGFVTPGGERRPGVRTTEVFFFSGPKPRQVSFGGLNLLTLGLYPAVMLAIGLWYAGRSTSAEDFFRGGRHIPWWAAGLSIYATMLSSITFMAIPAKAYATDWGFFLNYASILLLAPVVIAVYLPFFRQLDVTSAYEYLERRFNLAVRLFGSASFIVFQIGRTGIVLYLPALALSTVTELDIHACIIGMGVLTILLTVFGGMEAVIWTDVAQSIILLGAAVLSLIAMVGRCDGGMTDLWTVGQAHGKFFSNLSWSPGVTMATGWVILLGQLFTNLISYTSNQEVVQRYLTTSDERQAARAIWFNALVSIPSGLIFFALGTALFVFYRQHPTHLDPALARVDAIFPYFMVHELPAGLAGLVVAGIFAAAQPTSGLNSVATAVVTDFYQRFVPRADDRAQLRVGRFVTIIAGVLGTAAALTMVQFPVESLWELFLNLLGLTTGMLAGLFALGIFTRRAHGTGALLGILASGVILTMVLRDGRLYPLLSGAVAVVSCFGMGYVFSLLIPSQPKPLAGLTLFTRVQKTEAQEP